MGHGSGAVGVAGVRFPEVRTCGNGLSWFGLYSIPFLCRYQLYLPDLLISISSPGVGNEMSKMIPIHTNIHKYIFSTNILNRYGSFYRTFRVLYLPTSNRKLIRVRLQRGPCHVVAAWKSLFNSIQIASPTILNLFWTHPPTTEI